MTTYEVLIGFPEDNREVVEPFDATCYAEALTMAERKYAGVAETLICIPVAHFATARAEGVAFNDADGVVLDDTPQPMTVGAIVKYAQPEPHETEARYVVLEDNGDRVLVQSLDPYWQGRRFVPTTVYAKRHLVVVTGRS